MTLAVTHYGEWFFGCPPGFRVTWAICLELGPRRCFCHGGSLVCSVNSSRGRWSSREASISLEPNYPNFMVDETEAQRGRVTTTTVVVEHAQKGCVLLLWLLQPVGGIRTRVSWVQSCHSWPLRGAHLFSHLITEDHRPPGKGDIFVIVKTTRPPLPPIQMFNSLLCPLLKHF